MADLAQSPSTAPAAPRGDNKVQRLYRHALESIFGFASLHELSQIVAVNRDWNAAVRSMSGGGAVRSYERGFVDPALLTSPLTRFICSFKWPLHLNDLALALLESHLPLLQSLRCVVPGSPLPRALVFPPRLRVLHATFQSGFVHTVDTSTAVIAAASALEHLEELRLEFGRMIAPVRLRPLVALTRLHTLGVRSQGRPTPLNDEQIEDVRAMRSLRAIHVDEMDADLLSRLLLPPHQLQLQRLSQPGHALMLTDSPQLHASLDSLPSLTALDLVMSEPSVDLLLHLPSLTQLRLQVAPVWAVLVG